MKPIYFLALVALLATSSISCKKIATDAEVGAEIGVTINSNGDVNPYGGVWLTFGAGTNKGAYSYDKRYYGDYSNAYRGIMVYIDGLPGNRPDEWPVHQKNGKPAFDPFTGELVSLAITRNQELQDFARKEVKAGRMVPVEIFPQLPVSGPVTEYTIKSFYIW